MRRGGRRWWSAGLSAALVAGLPWTVHGTEHLPPRPVEVVPAQEVFPGAVAVEPDLVRVDVAAGGAAQPLLVVRNGAGRELQLVAEVVAVGAGDDGGPVVGGGQPVGDATGWIRLAADRVTLDHGELARLWPTVEVPADAGPGDRPAALRFRGEGVEVTAVIVVGVPAGLAPDPSGELEVRRTGQAETTVGLRIDGAPGVARTAGARIAIDAWYGRRVAEVSVPPVLVLPATDRHLEVALEAPPVPGPYHVQAVVAFADGSELRLEQRVLLADPLVVTGALASALLVVAVLLLLRARRRLPPDGQG